MVVRILGGVYLSSIEPINNGEDLKSKYSISHILSVIPGPLPQDYLKDYVHKQIEVTDEETSNLLEYFELANEFIEEGLFKESTDRKKHSRCVLVHCSQGVSRSVTVVVAYLMKKYKLTLEQAMHAVTRKLPEAQPNDGFMEQLKLYKEMDLKVDSTNDLYREFVINNQLSLDPTGSTLRDMDLFKPKQSQQPSDADKKYELRCKRCRQVLSVGGQVENHEPPEAESRQSQFIKKAPNSRRIISSQEASSSCSHHFLTEPLTWMKEELEKGELEGKLMCPKCTAKVGGYSWRGSRCSCGKWMIPAIHLQSAKVDSIKNIALPNHSTV